ncbi:MAG: DoxX family protein [Fuerstiella sp.]|nr:DoxX family protein [Fuerstiella sp.]MDG2128991.1 DoxX family protein [Fuerstiella sp.]
MTDIRRFSLAAVILLVVLRLAIGWQLLYEGLWKINTLKSPRPWTSGGYLKNSVGPLRDTFRKMAGDPDELGWLDYDVVAARWQSWAERFQKHYGLDEKQAESFRRLMEGSWGQVNGKHVYAAELLTLPEGVSAESLLIKHRDPQKKLHDIVWYDAGRKRLLVNAVQQLTPRDKAKLLSLSDDPKFQKAVNDVDTRQRRGMGYPMKLAGALKGNPELLGNEAWQRLGKLKQYKQELAEYEASYAKATTPFEWGHLKYTWGKIQDLRSELTGPIKGMEKELMDKAAALLTIEQQARGPVSEPWTALKFADTMTILGLTALGIMLVLGLFTRFAAAGAAFMLFNFYLAMPPLPGVAELPGPEHSFIVNKNLIEVFALLAIAALPTGLWFGLDRILSVFLGNWRADGKTGSSMKSTVATGDEPEAAAAT